MPQRLAAQPLPAQQAQFGVPAHLLQQSVDFLRRLIPICQNSSFTARLGLLHCRGICFRKIHVCCNRPRKRRRHRRDPAVVELYWLS